MHAEWGTDVGRADADREDVSRPEPRLNGRLVGVRWTVGDVSERGFEALRLSVWGAWRVFGPEARYTIVLNSLPLERAQALTGRLPPGVRWEGVAESDLGPFRRWLDDDLAEGVGWKFAPVRSFPDRFEIALDNDCILWDAPPALRLWIAERHPQRCLIAEDMRTCFGVFARWCGAEPRNSGIRGTPPGLDLERRLQDLLAACGRRLTSELDEQGLQVAATSWPLPPRVVRVREVTICSPFPPHVPELGRCGAHFVGLNARALGWDLGGRPATEWIRENWERQRPALYEKVGIRPE